MKKKILKSDNDLSVSSMILWFKENREYATQVVLGGGVLLIIGFFLIRSLTSAKNGQVTDLSVPTATEAAEIVPDVTPVEQQTAETTISKLPDTTSYVEYVVQAGDSFNRVSKRVCGDEKSSFVIKALNNIPGAMQAGKVVKVVCE